jgi:hypothetical protein
MNSTARRALKVKVTWLVVPLSANPDFTQPEASGVVTTGSSKYFTVKVSHKSMRKTYAFFICFHIEVAARQAYKTCNQTVL